MKRKISIVLVLLFTTLSRATLCSSEQAVVIVPVLDLGNPPALIIDSTQQEYNQFALDGGKKNPLIGCPRIHQLLFHEIVTVKKVNDTTYEFDIPNVFYVANGSKEPKCSYKTDKKNLILLKTLKRKKIDISKFPEPVSFFKNNINTIENTVTLIKPFTDPLTRLTFSAGTRFKKAVNALHKSGLIAVYVFDPISASFKTTYIPEQHLMLKTPETRKEKIKKYVEILRTWAHLDSGFIPYVWGGTSFTRTSNGTFTEVCASAHDVKTSFFELSDCPAYPKTGLDCSSLVWRVAQMCGIPYYCKNSATIAHFLQELNEGQVEDGDLIVIPRHVMIVSSVKNNMLVEARSYTHGYGKVQELPLNKVFHDVKTYKDLVTVYKQQAPLQRLNNEGQIAETLPYVKIVKMSSVWQ